jgi:hypothetical protein
MKRSVHDHPHHWAAKTLRLRAGVSDPIRGMVTAGAEFRLDDWWDRLNGRSWTDCAGNIAAFQYGIRILTLGNIPLDDEVVYGKIGPFGHLVHNSELSPPSDRDSDGESS